MIKAFVVKDLKELSRDKTAVFWMIVWPLLWLVLTAYVFIPPENYTPKTMKIGVVNYDVDSEYQLNGSLLIDVLERAEYEGVKLFNVLVYKNETLMLDEIKREKIDAGIIIPEGFGENLTFNQANLEIYVSAMNIQSFQINSFMLDAFLDEFSVKISNEKISWMLKFIPEDNVDLEIIEKFLRGIAKPINPAFSKISPEKLISRESWIGWYTIGALGMTMLYSGLNIGSVALMEEKQKRCLPKILASPITPSELIAGKVLFGVTALSIISVIIVIFGVGVCGARIYWDPLRIKYWIIPLVLLILALMVLGLGSLLSLVTKSAKGASNLSTSLGLLLAFLTGVWFPKDWFPRWMQILAEYSPATWAIEAIRKVMVFEADLAEVAPQILATSLVTFVVLAAGVIIYRKSLKNILKNKSLEDS